MDDKSTASGRDIGGSSVTHYRDVRLYENSWALVIGVNRYRHAGIPALQFAENDAVSMAELLPSLGFPKENIRLLLASRGEVSRHQIQQVVERDLNECMSYDDRLLVHFAGHGVSSKVWEKMSGYLLMPDSEIAGAFPSPETPYLTKMPTDALEMKQFLNALDNLPAKHKLLLIDTCFSGFMANTRSIEQVRINDARVPLWAGQPATHVLTAGRAGQSAFEDPAYQHGVFTWFVLQGLLGNADPRGDGLITFHDLANYVRHRVAGQGRQQDPQSMSDHDGVFMFIDRRLMERSETARREAEEDGRRHAAALARQEAEQSAQAELQRLADEEALRQQADEENRRRAADLARQEAEAHAQAELERQTEERARQREADEENRRRAADLARQEVEAHAQAELERQTEERARQREADEDERRQAAELARQEAHAHAELKRRAGEEAQRQQGEEEDRRRAADLARQEAEERAQAESKRQAENRDAAALPQMPSAEDLRRMLLGDLRNAELRRQYLSARTDEFRKRDKAIDYGLGWGGTLGVVAAIAVPWVLASQYPAGPPWYAWAFSAAAAYALPTIILSTLSSIPRAFGIGLFGGLLFGALFSVPALLLRTMFNFWPPAVAWGICSLFGGFCWYVAFIQDDSCPPPLPRFAYFLRGEGRERYLETGSILRPSLFVFWFAASALGYFWRPVFAWLRGLF